jgi:PAT family beta-lactamase induction signal transducer AmpG
MMILLVIAGIMVLAGLYHSRLLPPGAAALDAPKTFGQAMGTFGHAFATFFQKKGVWLMIAFAFFYRTGFGLIDKMGPLFMIDDRAKGGLGLSNQMLGDINGTFGTGAFILGSLVGGWFVSRAGLKKSLLILCLCLNVPNVTFLILSQTLPSNYYVIAGIVTLEKLGWGIGCVGHMIYMMQQIAPGPYKTAHYTIATALMGACMMSTGAVSGYVQKWVGYQWFFIIVLLAAAPSILVTLLAPFHHPDSAGPSAPPKPEPEAAAAV